ncbi:MAG TPA: fibronectin type III-like domain-contianing protein [Puia sp.]|nr:fibronectin type III-like domain-contianing protein [Puia sp.]
MIQVKFTVKNTGSRYGAEVAQLHVSDPIATVLRPAKELKAFEKVFLRPTLLEIFPEY